jgi:hypothetical protein
LILVHLNPLTEWLVLLICEPVSARPAHHHAHHAIHSSRPYGKTKPKR